MRILVLNHEFPPLGGGGGRAAESICGGLAQRGHEIKVLTSHIKGQPFNEQRDGYEIIRIPSLRTQPFRASLASMFAYILTGLWAGFRLIRLFRPDVIHAHFAVPAGALAWVLSKLTGIPYILTAHLGDVPGGVPEKTDVWFKFVFPFTHLIWKNADARVAVSEFTRALAIQYYRDEILVIPNGMDMTVGKPAVIAIHHPPVVVFAGRFMPQKNPLQVVRILNEVKDCAWTCVMLGDGPLLEDVKRVVTELGLKDRFHFLGWVTPDDVMDWFNKSDILFMPSLSEGLPVVGVQALSRGLAIVASRVGGFVDLVDDGQNGYLFSPKDTAGFSGSLRDLLSDPNRLLSLRNASLEIARRFDIHQIVERYDAVFLGVRCKQPND